MNIQEIASIMQATMSQYSFPEHWEQWEALSWPSKAIRWTYWAVVIVLASLLKPLLLEEGRGTFCAIFPGILIFIDFHCGRRTTMTQLAVALGKTSFVEPSDDSAIQ